MSHGESKSFANEIFRLACRRSSSRKVSFQWSLVVFRHYERQDKRSSPYRCRHVPRMSRSSPVATAEVMSIVVRSINRIRNVSSDVRINRMYRSFQYPQCRNQWFSTDQRYQLSLLSRFVGYLWRWLTNINGCLLDCRSRKEYDESHIISARHMRRVSSFQHGWDLRQGVCRCRTTPVTFKCLGMPNSKHVNTSFSTIVERMIYRWDRKVNDQSRHDVLVNSLSRWYLRLCGSAPTSCRWFDDDQDRPRRISTLLQAVSLPSHTTISLFS